MKGLIIALGVLLSGFANAQGKLVKSDDPAYPAYIEATTKALRAAKISECPAVEANWTWETRTFMEASQPIWISDGPQPLLVFKKVYTNGSVSHLTVTTDAAYKTITSVLIQLYEMERVNDGDLKNPKMVNKLVLDSKYTCTAKVK